MGINIITHEYNWDRLIRKSLSLYSDTQFMQFQDCLVTPVGRDIQTHCFLE